MPPRPRRRVRTANASSRTAPSAVPWSGAATARTDRTRATGRPAPSRSASARAGGVRRQSCFSGRRTDVAEVSRTRFIGARACSGPRRRSRGRGRGPSPAAGPSGRPRTRAVRAGPPRAGRPPRHRRRRGPGPPGVPRPDPAPSRHHGPHPHRLTAAGSRATGRARVRQGVSRPGGSARTCPGSTLWTPGGCAGYPAGPAHGTGRTAGTGEGARAGPGGVTRVGRRAPASRVGGAPPPAPHGGGAAGRARLSARRGRPPRAEHPTGPQLAQGDVGPVQHPGTGPGAGRRRGERYGARLLALLFILLMGAGRGGAGPEGPTATGRHDG